MSFEYSENGDPTNFCGQLTALADTASSLHRCFSENCTLPAILLRAETCFDSFVLKPALSPWTVGEVRLQLSRVCAHPKKLPMHVLYSSFVLKVISKYWSSSDL